MREAGTWSVIYRGCGRAAKNLQAALCQRERGRTRRPVHQGAHSWQRCAFSSPAHHIPGPNDCQKGIPGPGGAHIGGQAADATPIPQYGDCICLLAAPSPCAKGMWQKAAHFCRNAGLGSSQLQNVTLHRLPNLLGSTPALKYADGHMACQVAAVSAKRGTIQVNGSRTAAAEIHSAGQIWFGYVCAKSGKQGTRQCVAVRTPATLEYRMDQRSMGRHWCV